MFRITLILWSLLTMTPSETPTEPGSFLTHLVGNWTVEGRIWTGGPGEPLTTSGEARGEALFGGGHSRLHLELDLMGRPMLWELTLGHDGHREGTPFDFTLITNMSAATVRAQGALDDDVGAATVTYRGRMSDAMAGDRAVRHQIETQGEDGFVFRTWDTLPDGQEFQVMELQFRPGG